MKHWKDEKNAPANGQFLCNTWEVDENHVKEIIFASKSKYPFRLFIHERDGAYRCFMNKCPHFSTPLNIGSDQFFSTDKTQFMCFNHYAKFNFSDGLCTEGPCEGSSLDCIPIEIKNSAIYISY